MRPEPRSFLPALEQFKSGKDDPRRFLERCIETISEQEPLVQAFECLNLDGARRAADASTLRWRSGRPLSSVDGMPIGVKDIIETADMPTQEGSPLFVGRHTQRDAASVAALRGCGAVIIGKTVTTEFAATHPGKTRNPWDLQRTPGGSSSGSAAGVACGMMPAALGTQVIGSTIRPASYCGCHGYKPSVGALNRAGSYDYKSQSVTTVLAASLAEAWIVARTISKRAGGDPGGPGLMGPLDPPTAKKPARLAFLETAGWTKASPAAKATFSRVVAALRADGVSVIGRANDTLIADVEHAISDVALVSTRINMWEDHWPLNTYARDLDQGLLSAAMQKRLSGGLDMTQCHYAEALVERENIRAIYTKLSEVYDGCITLSAPGPAPVGIDSTGDPVFAIPASLLGGPAVSLPVMTVEDLPLGLQMMGFRDRDVDLIAAAGWVDTALGG